MHDGVRLVSVVCYMEQGTGPGDIRLGKSGVPRPRDAGLDGVQVHCSSQDRFGGTYEA